MEVLSQTFVFTVPTYALVYALVGLTAVRWWMLPLMRRFEKSFHMGHCRRSDFHFYCAFWPITLISMVLYAVWSLSVHAVDASMNWVDRQGNNKKKVL
jgi:hypothetical protein